MPHFFPASGTRPVAPASYCSRRLALVEDDFELRKRYADYLCQQPELLADSAADFFAQLPDVLHALQVMRLDIGLPGRSGLNTLPRFKQLLPATEVVSTRSGGRA